MKDKQQTRNRLKAYILTNLLVFAGVAYIASSKQILGWELSLFRFINELPDGLLLFFLIVTQAGSAWMLFGITLLLIYLRRSRLALRVFGTGVATFLLSELLKNIIGRPRPGLLLDATFVREHAVFDYGFPSSHTAVATAVSLVMLGVLPKRWRWVCWIWIAAVGFSRLYLGVHAPLDVVGGFAVGASVVCISLLVKGKLAFVRKITGLKLQR